MRSRRCIPFFRWLLGAAVSLSTAAAPAQQPVVSGMPAPRLFTLMPCGARAGTVVEVAFTGQDLEEPQGLLFSHPGITAEPVLPPAPPADPKKPAPRPPVTRFKVSVPPGTPLGSHDVRLVNRWGVSNARAFVVGDLPEVAEKEPNDDVPQAQRVELNTTVTGAVGSPTDVDYFVVSGRKGQRVVISCLTSSIDSRLRAALELYDGAGRQLAFNRHFQGHDALVDCTLPGDGDVFIRLYEFTHTTGGPDHYYRLTVSTAPWIDAIMPPLVEPGKPTRVTVYGRNLPGGQPDPAAVEDGRVLERSTMIVNGPLDEPARQRLAYTGHVPARSAGLDGYEFRVRNAAGSSNAYLMGLATAPLVVDNEANDTPQTAQAVPVPCEIAGRVERPGDRDWYQFQAKKGEVCYIEVWSERLGAATDMYFVLRNSTTKQDITEMDDGADTLSPLRFPTRTEDPPAYRFVAPADGPYQLMISSRDADVRGGPRQLYRARITPARPDFRVYLLPADDHRPEGNCLNQGGHVNYTVLVDRRDGFDGPVTLTAEGLPPGVFGPTQTIGPGLRGGELVLSAALDAPSWTGAFTVKATAQVAGRTVVREARPGGIVWPVKPQQRNLPAVSRLDRSLVLAVRERAPFNLSATPDPAAIVQGTKATATLRLSRLAGEFTGPVQVTVLEPQTHLPGGLTVNNNQPLTIDKGKEEATAVVDVKSNVPPGVYNVVLRGVASVPFAKDPAAKQKPAVTCIQVATPLQITVFPAKK